MTEQWYNGQIPAGIATRIEAIIDYLWKEEIENYMQLNDCSDTRAIEQCREQPEESHIFAYIVAISDWLSEQMKA